MKFGFVIPVYRHGAALEAVVNKIAQFNFPIIIIDDGNDEINKSFIRAVAKKYPQSVLIERKFNGGKGAAMNDGLRKAHEMGLTHILQIDSDGQHDISRIPRFLELSEQNPDALICGYPDYGEDVPKRRKNGRKIANAWIHIVCLSREIKDAMIGFRVYPVAPYVKLLERHAFIDKRMGYDIDILVHLSWAGVRIISESVKVYYPVDGISNFRMFRDNVRISFTFTRLCAGMIVRMPFLIARNIRRCVHGR